MSVLLAPSMPFSGGSSGKRAAVYDKASKRLIGTFDFLHPKDGSLSDKPATAPGKLRIVKPLTATAQHRLPQRSHSRRQPSTASSSSSSTATPSEPLSLSQCDSSLSLTSTSTFPAAYTTPAFPKQPSHTRRSVSSSALPSPTRPSHSTTTPLAPNAAAGCSSSPSACSSPSHQRAHTAEELSRRAVEASEPATPRQESNECSTLSSTPPQSPGSSCAGTPPPTVRKAARSDEHDDSGNSAAEGEVERTRRMDSSTPAVSGEADGSSGSSDSMRLVTRLEDGEEESEELTNTTLADASLPESEDGDDRRKRREGGEGGGDGGGGGGGSNQPVDESADDSTDAISDILDFMRQSILGLTPHSAASTSAPPVTLQQLVDLPASVLLARYKSVLAPVLSAHSEVRALREEVSALHVKVAEVEQAAELECRRQVELAKAEAAAKYGEELKRGKDKRDKKASRGKGGRSGDTCNTNATTTAATGGSRHNNTLANKSYMNQSLSFHDMSIDPTLSLTTDMLEPRTVTVTLSTLDLTTPTPHSSVTLALFSSRLAYHSLWNFVGQTESRLPSSPCHSHSACTAPTQLTFERRLTMREVKTWHARDKLRVSAYWVALQRGGGEERKEMMGQVECDAYRLFTAFGEQPQQSVPWEALKAQETADAILGYSVRQLCVPLLDEHGMQCGHSRLLIHAHITPPLSCDSYPPSPERVKRAGRHCGGGALAVDSSLNLSLINDSLANFNHSLAAPSFIDNEPLSPIFPTKHAHPSSRASSSSGRRSHRDSRQAQTAALERTQREDDTCEIDATNTTVRASQSVATQCETATGVECGAQTDAPKAAARECRDACTMTDEVAAPVRPALTICTQAQLTIEPALQIVTQGSGSGVAGTSVSGRGGASSCDNSPVVFHRESSGCLSSPSPTSPRHHSSACSSAASSPASSSQPAAAVSAVVTALMPSAASPLQATLVSLSAALSVPFPLAQAKLSTACQQSLHRTLGLLRRQYSSSLQWFLDTAAQASTANTANTATATATTKGSKACSGSASGAGSAAHKPTWNPSINPAAPSRLLSSIRLHSHWQPDASVTSCSHCQSAFSLLKRKHHCRLCGSTACDECSKKCVELSELGLPGPQRVCDVCEMVWSAGKGLKALGMPVTLLDVTGAPAKDDDTPLPHKPASNPAPTAQSATAAAAGSGKSRVRSGDEGKPAKACHAAAVAVQEDELDVTTSDKAHWNVASGIGGSGSAAPLQLVHSAHSVTAATPTLGRTVRVRPTPKRSVERESASAISSSGTARRVTRSAAKENANTINVPTAIPEATPKQRSTLRTKVAAVTANTHNTATGKALRA